MAAQQCCWFLSQLNRNTCVTAAKLPVLHLSAPAALLLQLLQAEHDLLAFHRLAAGSGGWFKNGSWIFHARRSRRPSKLGVTVSADMVVAYHTSMLVKGAQGLKWNNPSYNRFRGAGSRSLHRQDRVGSRQPGSGMASPAEGAKLRAIVGATSQQATAAASGAQEAAPAAPAAAQADLTVPMPSHPAAALAAALAEHCFWCARAYFSTGRPMSWFTADDRRWCQACKAARSKALDVYASSKWSARPPVASGACPNDGVGGCSACILPA